MAGKLLTDYLQTESGTLYVQNVTGSTIFSANASGFYTGTGTLVIGAGGPGTIQANNGLYSTNNFTGSYTDGIVVDYINGNGRISVGPNDGITFYNGGPANTPTVSISNTGLLSANTGASGVGTLAYSANVAPNFGLYNNWTITLTGGATLANATNTTIGQSGVIYINQDNVGGRTFAYGSMWKFPGATVPTLSTSANAVDILVYTVQSNTRIDANLLTNFN
jgi:hypothetical protein